MIIGNPSAWIVHFQAVHDKVFQAIKDVWPDCAKRFNAMSLENAITDQLSLMLQKHPSSRSNWLVIPQYKLLASALKGDVVTKGYIDFVIFFNLDQEDYIAYECKRLNVHSPSGFKTLAGKYVDEGVQRFVYAQYAQGLPFGVMIGYVHDSNVPNALAAVTSQIEIKSAQLKCSNTPPVTLLSPISSITRFSTSHSRLHGDIEIQHLLLPLRP